MKKYNAYFFSRQNFEMSCAQVEAESAEAAKLIWEEAAKAECFSCMLVDEPEMDVDAEWAAMEVYLVLIVDASAECADGDL